MSAPTRPYATLWALRECITGENIDRDPVAA